MSLVRLYQFPVSHYCEKVRWALDYKGIPHELRNLVPVWHAPKMLLMSGQSQLPVIEMEGKVISGSSEILRKLDERFPATPRLSPKSAKAQSEAEDLVLLCDKKLGPHVRRVCYYQILKSSETTYSLLSEGQGLLGKAKLRASLPVIIKIMQKGMRINSQEYLKSLDKINVVLDDIESRLGKRKYFTGGSFSSADLTIASLLAPLARPAGTIYAGVKTLPEGFVELVEMFNDRLSINWTRQLYAHHRQSHCLK